jgi:hypothetical protein
MGQTVGAKAIKWTTDETRADAATPYEEHGMDDTSIIEARKGDVILSDDNKEVLGIFLEDVTAPREGYGYALYMTPPPDLSPYQTEIEEKALRRGISPVRCLFTRTFFAPDHSYWQVSGGRIPRQIFGKQIGRPGAAQERMAMVKAIGALLHDADEHSRMFLEYKLQYYEWMAGELD